MREKRNARKNLVGTPKGERNLDKSGVGPEGRIILILILNKKDMKVLTALNWFMIGSSGGPL
jgi:hypothetical protein